MEPVLKKRPRSFSEKICTRCKNHLGPEDFAPTKSFFYTDGTIPICDECIAQYLESNEFNWEIVNRLCQYIDIPFVPAEFERLHNSVGRKVFHKYAEVFLSEEYETLGWDEYFQEFKKLKDAGIIDDELPLLSEEKARKLRDMFGQNYDDEALRYMDSLYNGLLTTQNINGSLQVDQALKICKISYELDQRILNGEDFDKILKSYDTLVKIAEFTPKNVKNANDFDSVGELYLWLEKRGWKNKYFDGVTKDIVDETMKNIQAYNQRLYTNESGIGDEISRRIEALKNAKKMENRYDLNQEYDLDEYEAAGYDELMKDIEEEFNVELEEE